MKSSVNTTALQIILIVLKLVEFHDWPWKYVLLPTLIPIGIILIMLAFYIATIILIRGTDFLMRSLKITNWEK